MKKIIFVNIMVTAFLISCSDTAPKNESNPLAGIWEQIGMINLKEGKFSDTLFWRSERLARPKVKFIGKGIGNKINSLWFRSDKRKDSTATTTSYDGEFYFNEWYVASKVEVKNDSFFSRGVYFHDLARTNARRREYIKKAKEDTTIRYKSKIHIDGDYYSQYRLSSDGTGRGELWKRLDHVGKNPTVLTGIFERASRVFYNADGTIRDSISAGSSDESHNFFMFGDKMMARVANAKFLDDEGVDQQQGQALLVNYNIDNDSLVENIVFGTRRFQGPNYPASWVGTRRSQFFEVDQEYFILTQIHSSGDGRKNVQYFKKIE